MKKIVLIFIVAVAVCLCGCSINGKSTVELTDRSFKVFEVSEIDTGCYRYNNPRENEKSKTIYEYYLTKEELLEEIKKGYIFHLDTLFKKETLHVPEGRWPFYVHENNFVNLEIEISNLIAGEGRNVDPKDGRIAIKLISPSGKCVYHFEGLKGDFAGNNIIKEQIPVTVGEWELRVSFVHINQENVPRLKIAAAYELPSEKDLKWLRKERLKEPCGR